MSSGRMRVLVENIQLSKLQYSVVHILSFLNFIRVVFLSYTLFQRWPFQSMQEYLVALSFMIFVPVWSLFVSHNKKFLLCSVPRLMTLKLSVSFYLLRSFPCACAQWKWEVNCPRQWVASNSFVIGGYLFRLTSF